MEHMGRAEGNSTTIPAGNCRMIKKEWPPDDSLTDRRTNLPSLRQACGEVPGRGAVFPGWVGTVLALAAQQANTAKHLGKALRCLLAPCGGQHFNLPPEKVLLRQPQELA